MGTREHLVPLPAALARAAATLRLVQPPPGLEHELRARLFRAGGRENERPKRRLVIIGSVLLALLTELSPLLAAA